MRTSGGYSGPNTPGQSGSKPVTYESAVMFTLLDINQKDLSTQIILVHLSRIYNYINK